jgi:Cu+-exporting ATPase
LGKPTLTDLHLAPGLNADQTLAQLAAIQSHSEHPIGLAIVQAAQYKPTQPDMALADHAQPALVDFTAISGSGVTAQLEGRQYALGSARLMRDLGIDIEAFSARFAALASQGKTPVYIARDGSLIGVLAVADMIKDSARPALNRLHAMGIKTVMITGDNTQTANAVAAELGIDEVHAETLPDSKVAVLGNLKAHYGTLAFVGDGINDAPALAFADVGIAIGAGTDVAIESASVVLMNEDLRSVAAAVRLSHAALRNIRQNLFWAFAYNIALIPVAAGLLYPAYGLLLSPMLGAGAMAFSSVFVVMNALRLKRV